MLSNLNKLFLSLITVCMFNITYAQCDMPENTLSLDGNSVWYNSTEAIAGFQFVVNGASLSGASGGDAADAGFTVSTSPSGTVLGFSFSGATIPAGCGTMVELETDGVPVSLSGIVVSDSAGNGVDFSYYDGGGGGEDVEGCTDPDACNYNADANIDDGSCTGPYLCEDGATLECDLDDCPDDGGDIETGCDLPTNNFYLLGSDVLFNSDIDIAGFQFDVDGATVSGASGGAAADAGFTVSAGGSTVLGFSFSGATISAGCGTLTSLDLSGNPTGFSGIVVSDSGGNGVDFSYYDDGGGDDCPSGVYDCAGVCDGSAEVDECGECGGDGIDEGACDCDDNVEDCAGDCGGSAEVDDCGECGGDGADIMCEDGSYVCDTSDCSDDTEDDVTVSVVSSQADAGSQASVFINMANDQDIGGFQFVVSDLPDLLSYIDILTTDRTSEFTISANEGEQGVIALGFSFTGDVVSSGDGPIVEIVYNVGMVDFDTVVDLALSGSVLSDPFGGPVNHDTEGGTFTIVSAPLTTPDSPSNVDAEGGQNSVSVSWDTVWQAQAYHVFRDGNIVGDVDGNSFTETDLENETTYCYSVTAYNSAGESDPSGEACGTTFPEYTGPPVLSVGSASINAGDVFDIDVSLANPGNPVAGLQVQILDAPDHLNVNDVVATDRLAGFTLSFNEQADGSVLFVAFSLTGDVVAPGTGPVAVINYQSVTVYEAIVALNVSESILSDSNGQPIDHDATGGTVLISGEEPPPEAPDTPTGLVAVEGDNQVDISWNASFGASEYLLYRENQGGGGGGGGGDGDAYLDCPDGSAEYGDCIGTCFNDADCTGGCLNWLGDGYCDDGTWGLVFTCDEYGNDCGDCDALDDPIGICDDDGGGGGGGQDDCEDGTVPDCSGDGDCCPESWIGDGFEDCEDQAYGCDLTCYDNDGGDCSGDGGGGGGSEDCASCEFDFTPYGAECCDTAWGEFGINCADLEANYNWDCSGCTCPGDGLQASASNDYVSELHTFERELYIPNLNMNLLDKMSSAGELLSNLDDNPVNNNSREFVLIATLTGTSYVDTDVVSGNNYCYYAIASNVSGISDPSNTDCAEPYGLNAPTNLVATGEEANIHLQWTVPEGNDGGGGEDSCEDLGLVECPDGSCAPTFNDCDDGGGDGIGDACTDAYGYPGQLDCQLQCIPQDVVDAWLGDGLCDDGTWGVYLDCEEFAFDNGDCDGGGGGGNEDCEGSGGLESWIADGWCDSINNIEACSFDGGDCCPCTCVDSTYDCATYGGTCDDCIQDGDASLTCPDECGNGGGGGGYDCVDCQGQDCTGYEGWIGDGLCDDGTWGIYFNCEEFDCDGGDCTADECGDGGGGGGGGGDGTCAASFVIYGSDPDGYYGECWEDGSAYFYFYWEGGCTATNINYSGGDLDLSSYGFTEGFYFYGFENAAEETFTMSFSDGTTATQTATADCNFTGSCTDLEGQVDDCSGDGDCCPESWIGDGYADCEDQAYGCDLTCYDNDGGDCGGQREDVTYAPIEKMHMFKHHKTDENISHNLFSDVSIFDLVIRQNMIEELNSERLEADRIKYHTYLMKEFQSHMLMASLYNNDLNDTDDSSYSNRDLQGYNVLRDGSEIGFTENTSYDDSNVTPGVEYCYTVVAVYDEGESSQSNVDCATASSPPNPVGLSVGNESVAVGEVGELEISMDNDDPVAGFQFTLSLSPDIGNILNVTTTDRTAGFNVSTNNGIVVGFSLSGDVITPGTGPIVVLEVLGNSAGSANACLNDVIISDPAGQAMNPTSTCGNFTVTEEPVDPVVLSVGSGSSQVGGEGSVSVNMSNNDSVGGFQFNIDINPDIASIVGVNTTDRTEGFTVSTANGIVVGFSMTGDVIAPGTGSILEIVLLAEDDGDAEVCLDSIVLSDPFGQPMPSESSCGSFSATTGPVYGCTDDSACNYDSSATDDDDSCEYESCAGCTDEEALNYNPDATLDDGSCVYETTEHFVVELAETGESSLVIIESGIDLDPGDEVGLFDMDGVLESVETGVDPEYGEVLVGAGVWTGEQVNIVGIGSVDLSQFGGPVLNGYIDGNAIAIKVWKSSEDAEYDAVATYSAGDGNWGAILTVISVLEPVFSVVQELEINPYQMNFVSMNVIPEDNSTSTILGGADILLVSNDQSDYYVPSFDVDQIGALDVDEAFSCFLNGANQQTIAVEGLPVDLSTSVDLDPFMMNLMPFLPQECMATSDVFAGYDDQILIVKNDASDYYVPSYNVETLSEMCPGEGYAIFLNGSDGIDFTYPMGAASYTTDMIDDYKMRTRTDAVTQTGLSHLVLVTDISGEVAAGDQLRAYADNQLVGAINIVSEHLSGYPIDLIAVGGADLSQWNGPVLEGYEAGNAIELRLYSSSRDVELKVIAEFDNPSYGNDTELSIGSAIVEDVLYDEIPVSFELKQNYPNPFNPSTKIDYTIETSGHVSLKIYDVMGRLVRTLVDEHQYAGSNGNSITWNGLDNLGNKVSAGIYIYSLQSEGMNSTKKMVLMK